MFSTVQDWSNITDRESISKYLPFRDFETNTGIFATNDDGFGILVECSPLMGVDKNVESAISSALSILPDNTAIQIMLLASPNVTSIVDNWHVQKQRAFNDPLCHDIAYRAHRTTQAHHCKRSISPSFYLKKSHLRGVNDYFLGKNLTKFTIRTEALELCGGLLQL